jgi:predicted nucleic acid-binding protein
MNAVDTNVLIYSNDSREPVKRQIALNLLANLTDAALLWQVACEYIAAARKLEKYGFTQKDAFADLALLRQTWKPVLPTWQILIRAENLMNNYPVSYWDALIIAACLENNIPKLYTEDIADNFRKEGLEIINPF